jgi:hypothetical protein
MAALWDAWAAELERVFVALLSVCALLHSHDAEAPTFAALRAAIERMTQQKLDAQTLAVLGDVHKDCICIKGTGEDLAVHLSCLKADDHMSDGSRPLVGAKRPRARGAAAPSTLLQRRSFASRPAKTGALPQLIAGEVTKLRDAIVRYRQSQPRDATPPPP